MKFCFCPISLNGFDVLIEPKSLCTVVHPRAQSRIHQDGKGRLYSRAMYSGQLLEPKQLGIPQSSPDPTNHTGSPTSTHLTGKGKRSKSSSDLTTGSNPDRGKLGLTKYTKKSI